MTEADRTFMSNTGIEFVPFLADPKPDHTTFTESLSLPTSPPKPDLATAIHVVEGSLSPRSDVRRAVGRLLTHSPIEVAQHTAFVRVPLARNATPVQLDRRITVPSTEEALLTTTVLQ